MNGTSQEGRISCNIFISPWLHIFMIVCQSKCDTSSMKVSKADFQFKHLRGRLLMRRTASANSSSVTKLKSCPLGKNSRSNPFAFSFDPRCHDEYGSAK